jgi:hypothetical protein
MEKWESLYFMAGPKKIAFHTPNKWILILHGGAGKYNVYTLWDGPDKWILVPHSRWGGHESTLQCGERARILTFVFILPQHCTKMTMSRSYHDIWGFFEVFFICPPQYCRKSNMSKPCCEVRGFSLFIDLGPPVVYGKQFFLALPWSMRILTFHLSGPCHRVRKAIFPGPWMGSWWVADTLYIIIIFQLVNAGGKKIIRSYLQIQGQSWSVRQCKDDELNWKNQWGNGRMLGIMMWHLVRLGVTCGRWRECRNWIHTFEYE